MKLSPSTSARDRLSLRAHDPAPRRGKCILNQGTVLVGIIVSLQKDRWLVISVKILKVKWHYSLWHCNWIIWITQLNNCCCWIFNGIYNWQTKEKLLARLLALRDPLGIKLLASVEIKILRVVIESLILTFVSVTQTFVIHIRHKQSKHQY